MYVGVCVRGPRSGKGPWCRSEALGLEGSVGGTGRVRCSGSLLFSWRLSSFLANSCHMAVRVCPLTLLTLNSGTSSLFRGMAS